MAAASPPVRAEWAEPAKSEGNDHPPCFVVLGGMCSRRYARGLCLSGLKTEPHEIDEGDCGTAARGKRQRLHPAIPYYPSREENSILGVVHGVLLWADMNAATPPGSRGRSALLFAQQPCHHFAGRCSPPYLSFSNAHLSITRLCSRRRHRDNNNGRRVPVAAQPQPRPWLIGPCLSVSRHSARLMGVNSILSAHLHVRPSGASAGMG